MMRAFTHRSSRVIPPGNKRRPDYGQHLPAFATQSQRRLRLRRAQEQDDSITRRMKTKRRAAAGAAVLLSSRLFSVWRCSAPLAPLPIGPCLAARLCRRCRRSSKRTPVRIRSCRVRPMRRAGPRTRPMRTPALWARKSSRAKSSLSTCPRRPITLRAWSPQFRFSPLRRRRRALGQPEWPAPAFRRRQRLGRRRRLCRRPGRQCPQPPRRLCRRPRRRPRPEPKKIHTVAIRPDQSAGANAPPSCATRTGAAGRCGTETRSRATAAAYDGGGSRWQRADVDHANAGRNGSARAGSHSDRGGAADGACAKQPRGWRRLRRAAHVAA